MSTLKQVKLEIPFAKLGKLLILNKKIENTCFEQQIEHLLASQHWHFKNISVGNLVLGRVSGSKVIKTLKIPLSCVRFLGVFSLFSKKLFRKQTFFLQISCPLLGVNFPNAEKSAPPKFAKCKVFQVSAAKMLQRNSDFLHFWVPFRDFTKLLKIIKIYKVGCDSRSGNRTKLIWMRKPDFTKAEWSPNQRCLNKNITLNLFANR